MKFPIRLPGSSKPKSTEESSRSTFYARVLTAPAPLKVLSKYHIGPAEVIITADNNRGKYLVNEPPLSDEEQKVYSTIMESLYYSLKPAASFDDPVKYVEQHIREVAEELAMKDQIMASFDKYMYYVSRDSVGYGIVDVPMRDEDTEEVGCEGFGTPVAVIHKKFTQYDWLDTNITFKDDDEMKKFVQRLAQRSGKTVTTAVPFTDMMTDEGHRVALTFGKEVTIPGSTFNVRKFPKKPLSITFLIKTGMLSSLIAAYYWVLIENKAFLLVLGPMGCYDSETQVLTKRGWVPFPDASIDDEVLSLNQETFEMEYLKPKRKFAYPYSGPMVNFQGKSLDFRVTPDHNMFASKWTRGHDSRKYRFMPASDMNTSWHFKRDGVWKGKEVEFFVLPGLPRSGRYDYPAVSIPMDSWLKFLGWWLAEGSLGGRHDGHYRVLLTQKKNIEEVESALESLPFACRKDPQPQSKGSYNFTISDKRLWTYLSRYEHARHKRIPEFVKDLSSRQITLILDALLKGDGYTHKGNRVFGTSSEKLADDIQELVLKTGASATVSQTVGRDREIQTMMTNGMVRVHLVKGGGVQYHVSVSRKHLPSFNPRFRRPSIIAYNDFVYCFELPKNHTMYVRRNGKAFWCGNSGKTSITNAFATLIRPSMKIATIEDTPEITLPHTHWQRFQSRKSYSIAASKFDVDLQDLTVLSMRYRPDYIILGEVRGAEVSALVQAASTGHGSITSFHAEDEKAALVRLSSPPMNVSVGGQLLIWSLLLVGRLKSEESKQVIRRVVSCSEIASSPDGPKLTEIFRYNPRKGTFTPDDPQEVVNRSDRLRTLLTITGMDEKEMVQDLEKKRRFLDKLVLENKIDQSEVTEAMRQYYGEEV